MLRRFGGCREGRAGVHRETKKGGGGSAGPLPRPEEMKACAGRLLIREPSPAGCSPFRSSVLWPSPRSGLASAWWGGGRCSLSLRTAAQPRDQTSENPRGRELNGKPGATGSAACTAPLAARSSCRPPHVCAWPGAFDGSAVSPGAGVGGVRAQRRRPCLHCQLRRACERGGGCSPLSSTAEKHLALLHPLILGCPTAPGVCWGVFVGWGCSCRAPAANWGLLSARCCFLPTRFAPTGEGRGGSGAFSSPWSWGERGCELSACWVSGRGWGRASLRRESCSRRWSPPG